MEKISEEDGEKEQEEERKEERRLRGYIEKRGDTEAQTRMNGGRGSERDKIMEQGQKGSEGKEEKSALRRQIQAQKTE